MSRYAVRLDRVPVILMAVVVTVIALIGANEVVNGDHDGMVASLSPYFAILLAVAWAAPVPARELESGSATWAWSMGAPRRRWLVSRTAPIFLAAVVGGVAVGGVEAWTEQHWLPALTSDDVAPGHVAAAWPVGVGLAVFAAGLGVAAALVSRKVVTAVGATLIAQVAVTLLAPVVAVALAPERTSSGSSPVLGHVVGQDTVAGALQITYVPNSAFWPVAFTLGAVLVTLGLLLGALALFRVTRVDG
jgi:hypothetical protein